MKSSSLKFISTIPWFKGLPAKMLAYLARNSRVQRFPAGTMLFLQGEIPDFCYIALEGSIELFVKEAGTEKEALVEISYAPNAYTMAAVLLGVPYIVCGRTVTATTTLLLDARALRRAIRENPKLAMRLLGLISWQFRNMVRQVVNLKSKSTSERLGCYLLMLTEAKSIKSDKIVLPLDRRRLAAHLGMTKMSLLRAFKTLSEYGVRTRDGQVTVTDYERLRAHSKPENITIASEKSMKLAN